MLNKASLLASALSALLMGFASPALADFYNPIQKVSSTSNNTPTTSNKTIYQVEQGFYSIDKALTSTLGSRNLMFSLTGEFAVGNEKVNLSETNKNIPMDVFDGAGALGLRYFTNPQSGSLTFLTFGVDLGYEAVEISENIEVKYFQCIDAEHCRRNRYYRGLPITENPRYFEKRSESITLSSQSSSGLFAGANLGLWFGQHPLSAPEVGGAYLAVGAGKILSGQYQPVTFNFKVGGYVTLAPGILFDIGIGYKGYSSATFAEESADGKTPKIVLKPSNFLVTTALYF